MTNLDNYTLLIQKLDQFIRKYYINQLLRGSLLAFGLILLLFLSFNLLEYQFYFSKSIRKILFYSFIGISATALFGWVFLPLLHYFRLGKIISKTQAAVIIGDHFSNVKDKLLNILQLHEQSKSFDHKELILAGINQKSEEVRPVPFRAAINLSQNKRYLKYALPPLLLLLIIFLAAPGMIKESTKRLIQNNKEFERPAPFRFVVQNKDLSVVQFSDFLLHITVEGDQLPNEAFIEFDNFQYRLTKDAGNKFSYSFNNVEKDTRFRLLGANVSSTELALKVLKKPNIASFEVTLDFPAYTGRIDEKLNNIGDLNIPIGTQIDWVFTAENTDGIEVRFSSDNRRENITRFSDDLFTYKKRALTNETYTLLVSNEFLDKADSIQYAIAIIPDLYPSISAEKFQDSTDEKLLYFIGEAADDYGLTSLSFNYRIAKANREEGELKIIRLEKPQGKQTQFEHAFDLNTIELKPGEQLSYYFEVYDNDAVNGNKPARTSIMTYAKPTLEEYKAMADKNEEEIKENLAKSIEESKKIQEELKKLREKMLQQKDIDWQTRKELEKLLERQKELEKQIQEAKENFQENLKNQEEFSKNDQEILEKQEQLEELFNEALSEELKEMMEKIEKLLEELNKDEALEMMEDFEMNDEQLEKELDRMLELFKQLELEKEMQESLEELQELAEQQEELSEKTEKGETPQEQLKEEQEKINEKFEEIEQKMEEIEQKNEELENPKELEDQEEERQEIQEELDNSQEQLQQNQNQKASQSQKNAAQKMKQMANSMAMQMQASEMDQMMEDMESLRQLLENLVSLSFDQESLMESIAETEVNTPKYTEEVQKQFKLNDDFTLIEDSLQALSKRVFQIESFVTEKVTEIKDQMGETIDLLEERKVPESTDQQQRIMKNVNDLALMLSEVMNQMQQQMAAAMQGGNQECPNPGQGQQPNGASPSDKLSKGQQNLNQQLRQMKEGLEKGQGGTSRQFAEMAARQAALQKALRDKQKKLQEQGQGSEEIQDLLEQMDKVETDLVNKKLTNEILKRQEDILTRLLEHEKAEREREFEEKRKSETAQPQPRELPPSLEEYLKKRKAEIDLLKTVSPALKPYYKSLVEEYFNSLKNKAGNN